MKQQKRRGRKHVRNVLQTEIRKARIVTLWFNL